MSIQEVAVSPADRLHLRNEILLSLPSPRVTMVTTLHRYPVKSHQNKCRHLLGSLIRPPKKGERGAKDFLISRSKQEASCVEGRSTGAQSVAVAGENRFSNGGSQPSQGGLHRSMHAIGYRDHTHSNTNQPFLALSWDLLCSVYHFSPLWPPFRSLTNIYEL